jgi:CHASE2 domain-containing sensor protein
MSPNFDGAITGLIILGMLFVAALWGLWELIDWMFIDDAIRTSQPIVPDVEIVIKNNVADTTYVYRKP